MIKDGKPILHQCERCERTKITTLVTFKQNVSYFFQRQEFSGRVCLGCMNQEFLKFEFVTLVGTWCGIIGCLLGPVYILTNLLEYLFSGSFLIMRDTDKLGI